MKISQFDGKTIKSMVQHKARIYDDRGFIVITFTDDTKCLIRSEYGEFTRESKREYQTLIYAFDVPDHFINHLEPLKKE